MVSIRALLVGSHTPSAGHALNLCGFAHLSRIWRPPQEIPGVFASFESSDFTVLELVFVVSASRTPTPVTEHVSAGIWSRLPMWFGCQLVRRRKIRMSDYVDAVARHFESRPPLGEVALRSRMLSMNQVFAVLSRQSETQQQFGKAAVELGYLDESQLALLLLRQVEAARSVEELLIESGAITREKLDKERQKILASSLDARSTTVLA